ncbi:MAG TPA: hypothetical protein VM580_04310 [Labilithrix sp.]|nr:hypothetical protein [Labilithrix sp.]
MFGLRWHRTRRGLVTLLMLEAGILLLAGCSTPPVRKPIEMEPIGTLKNVPTTPLEEPNGRDVTTPNSGTPAPGTSACSGNVFENLEEIFRQCDVPMPRPGDLPSLKDKLEVTVTTSAPSTPPGGRVEVVITLRNKTSDPLPLYLAGDPGPRIDVEAFDVKGKRVDVPASRWPGFPKGFKPEPREAKAAKITLEKNGTVRLRGAWDARKMKWAPEKARSWDGRGYPRVPAGPLAPGTYTLRVILPLLGEADVPKMLIEVGRN